MMKRFIVLAVTVFHIGLPASAENRDIDKGFLRAQEIIEMAIKKCNSENNQYRHLLETFNSMPFTLVYSYSEHCADGALGRTSRVPDTELYRRAIICADNLRYVGWWAIDALAQVMIHEALHQAFNDGNEVKTRAREIKTMVTGAGFYWKSEYVPMYNFSSDVFEPGCL